VRREDDTNMKSEAMSRSLIIAIFVSETEVVWSWKPLSTFHPNYHYYHCQQADLVEGSFACEKS
jgi:hypothetical protein